MSSLCGNCSKVEGPVFMIPCCPCCGPEAQLEAALKRELNVLELVDAILTYNRGLLSKELDQRRKDAWAQHEKAIG